MKVAVSLFALIFTTVLAQAGSFGGPPPFTNGSPLITGVDGSYQATARNTNLTGIFRFTYINGRQTSAADFPAFDDSIETLMLDPYNDYVFFVNGLSYRGLVQANINGGSIGGVLDNGASVVPNFVATVGDVDVDGLTALSSLSGEFNGTIDTSSSNYAFSGKGNLTISNYDIVDLNPDPDDEAFTIVVAGTFQRVFNFHGIRNSQNTTSTGS